MAPVPVCTGAAQQLPQPAPPDSLEPPSLPVAREQLAGTAFGCSTKTWVFLSDLCQIGRLEPLSTLLSRGPAADVTVALTLEDVEMLQRHYPYELTGILGLCGNYALLKMPNPITARWASQLLGIEKVQIFYQTEGTLSGKTSHGVTLTNAERPLVAPTEFQELPSPEHYRGPVGYFKSPDLQDL